MPAVSFKTVLASELAAIEQRRKDSSSPPEDPVRRALDADLLGVGFSGGGIRSATFNLGLLQGLCQQKLLRHVDYLSTVSGGGYIGCWLHGVIKHRCSGSASMAEGLLDDSQPPRPAGEDAITWLRKYSNYLAPRLGLFSRDVWVLGSLWLRNFLLNQTVILTAIAGVLLVPVLLAVLPDPSASIDWRWYVGGLALAVATAGVGLRLSNVARRELNKEPNEFAARSPLDAGLCALALCIFAMLAGTVWTNPVTWPVQNQIAAIGGLFVLYAALQELGWFRECFAAQHKSGGGGVLLVIFAAVCTVLNASLLVGIFRLMDRWYPVEVLAWGPPLVALTVLAGITLLIGLMGADYPDSCREWLARTGSLVLLMMLGWAAAFAFGVFAPDWVAQFFDKYWKTASAAAGAWLVTSAAGVLAGNSTKTRSAKADETSGPLEFLTKLAPAVFLFGYLVLISMACHYGLRQISGYSEPATALNILEFQPRTVDSRGAVRFGVQQDARFEWVAAIRDNHYKVLSQPWKKGRSALLVLFAAIGGFTVVCLVMGGRVNINEFSIHHLYKNRLVRCYLGASKNNRSPNSWTGFDPQDDFKLTQLVPANGYLGPYPIVNTAVNINTGSELATQDRKAASFFFSPLYSGFVPKISEATTGQEADGFIPTNLMTPDGPALGTAMAISGAAANPNMGYHTSGPVAFLLTVFNIRLGWWVGNPRLGPAYSARTGPAHALPYLVAELLGMTRSDSNYLNLSDGGHFDNLGLYELVRRRCRYIIIGDGEQDPAYSFGSLAGTIRRCRADFGVDIELDFDRIRQTDGLSKVHAVTGRVIYRERNSAGERETGTILYVKASVTGDEPEDIREFRSRFAEFPHQSTGDQFFDEAQFESYRQLGLHTAISIFEGIGTNLSIKALFHELEESWHPPSTVAAGVTTRLADTWSDLLGRLSSDPALQALDPAFCVGDSRGPKPDEAGQRRIRLFCVECIQLMENVYTDLNFESRQQWNNPANGGWHTLFHHWGHHPTILEAWERIRHLYNPRFRKFFEALRS
jgi:hypothetical protein